jgi:hypothetical protein
MRTASAAIAAHAIVLAEAMAKTAVRIGGS